MGLLDRLWKTSDYRWYEAVDLAAMARRSLPESGAEYRAVSLDEIAPWIVGQGEVGLGDRREDESIRRGDHLIVAAEIDGEFTGYIKLGWDALFLLDLDREVTFPDETGFVYDTYVSPRFRGRHLALGLILSGARQLRERGFTRYVCHIRTNKVPSQRAFTRAGFASVADFRIASRFGRVAWRPSLDELLARRPVADQPRGAT